MKPAIFILLSAFIVCACNNKEKLNDSKNDTAAALKTKADTTSYTEIQWLDSIIDFGTMKTEDSMHFKFRFKNTGSKPLLISDAEPACGCTVTDYPKDPIMPGKTNFISATFNSNFSVGPVFKTITVTANTKNNSQHVLLLHGEIVPKKNK